MHAICYQAFRHAIVHHAPNKYLHLNFARLFEEQRRADKEHLHNHAVSVSEMEAAIEACMRDSNVEYRSARHETAAPSGLLQPWRINNISYVVKGQIRGTRLGCTACMKDSKATHAVFNFQGSAEAALRNRSSLLIELRCDETLTTQEHAIERSKERRDDAWELGEKSARLTKTNSILNIQHKSDAFPVFTHPYWSTVPTAGGTLTHCTPR